MSKFRLLKHEEKLKFIFFLLIWLEAKMLTLFHFMYDFNVEKTALYGKCLILPSIKKVILSKTLKYK